MDRELESTERWRRNLRRSLPWIGGLLVAGAAVPYLLGFLQPSLDASRIRIGRVEPGSIEAVLTAAGRVQPAFEQVVSSPIEARVLRVLVQPGSKLKKGDPILELDVSEAQLALERLEGRREQAVNERRELELRLNERLIELRAQHELGRLDVEEATHQLARDEQLHEQGLTSETVVRTARIALRRTEIEEQRLARSIANSRSSKTAQLARIDSQLRTIDAELEDARKQAATATTRADRDGVLTWVVAEEGITVRAGDVLARVADPSRFRVDASIADLHAARLAEGQLVRLPIGDVTLDGTIARILPAIDQGALQFRIALNEPDHPALRANLRTEVLVVLERRDEVLRLGKGPAVPGSGRQRVFVVDPITQRAVAREVVLGLSGHRHYEVVSGLEQGERVVLSDVGSYEELDEIRIESLPPERESS
ncbi:MAG: HlyD family efflux transporter periplasmic adaptor subunit [Acidobacteriota bacterium]